MARSTLVLRWIDWLPSTISGWNVEIFFCSETTKITFLFAEDGEIAIPNDLFLIDPKEEGANSRDPLMTCREVGALDLEILTPVHKVYAWSGPCGGAYSSPFAIQTCREWNAFRVHSELAPSLFQFQRKNVAVRRSIVVPRLYVQSSCVCSFCECSAAQVLRLWCGKCTQKMGSYPLAQGSGQGLAAAKFLY